MNKTEMQRALFEAKKEKIIRVYNLSALQYNSILFDLGCELVTEVTAVFFEKNQRKEVTKKVIRSSEYWNWFTYQWMMDDTAMIDDVVLNNKDYKALKKMFITEKSTIKKTIYKINEIIEKR